MTTTTQTWVRGPFSALGVVGVLTPPANTTVEPEIASLLPSGLSLHASRLPGRNSEDTSIGLRERFLGYNATLAESADSFGGLPLDALFFACTGCTYLVGADGEAGLLASLSASGTGQVQTAAGGLRAVLAAAQLERVAMVSPYPDWLTEAAVAYWTSVGFGVADVTPASTGRSIYAVGPGEVADAVRRLRLDQVDAVILTGTGMATAQAIAEIGDEFGIPLLSPNTTGAWWLTRAVAPHALGKASALTRAIDGLVKR